MGKQKFDELGFTLPEGLKLSGRDDLPEVTGDLLVDVDGYVGHGEVLEEGAPWRWGDEVKAIPVIPDKTDGSLEPMLGSTPLQREPK